MKRLTTITIITILTFLGGLYILTHLDKYHDEIITPATTDLSQASVNINSCIININYDIDSLHGIVTEYKGIKLELVLIKEIPCNASGLSQGSKIVLKYSNMFDINILSHESYHWCHTNGFDVYTNVNQYNEETMAYCVGDVTNIVYKLSK